MPRRRHPFRALIERNADYIPAYLMLRPTARSASPAPVKARADTFQARHRSRRKKKGDPARARSEMKSLFNGTQLIFLGKNIFRASKRPSVLPGKS